MIQEVREKLKEFVEYEIAIDLRRQLHAYAMDNYVQKYSDSDYIKFMERYDCSFEKMHVQDQNRPYYYGMFSVVTQHIHGDCIKELLDNAIDIEKTI